MIIETSEVCKCDLCQNVYNRQQHKNIIDRNATLNMNNWEHSLIIRNIYHETVNQYKETRLDLCPECTAELQKLFRKRINKGETK